MLNQDQLSIDLGSVDNESDPMLIYHVNHIHIHCACIHFHIITHCLYYTAQQLSFFINAMTKCNGSSSSYGKCQAQHSAAEQFISHIKVHKMIPACSMWQGTWIYI